MQTLTRAIAAHVRQNQLLRHSALLFAGYLVAHALNTLYQMVVSRVLAPPEYTLLAAFVGALLILQYPLMTLTTGLSRYSSLLIEAGRQGDVRRLLTRWLIRSGCTGLILAVIILLARHNLAEIFHIARTGPLVVAAISLPTLLMLPIVLGVSQGMQRFGWNATSTMLGSLARLLLGTGFVLLLYPTSGWGLLGHGAGTGLNVVLLAGALYWILRPHPCSTAPLPQLRTFLAQSGVIQIAYATLMTADIILVKYYLPHEHEFAYAATLGRLAVFLSSTIVIAMFPKVTAIDAITREQFGIFKQSLLYTALCATATVAGCALFPRLLLRVLFGIDDPSRTMQMLTIGMACVMGISAILNTCLQFLIAQKRFLPALWVVAAATGYILASTIWSAHAWQILALAAGANTLPIIPLLYACWHGPRSS